MNEQERHELFDRYLRGELEEQELDQFLKDLKSDEELENDFQTYRLLVEGIRQHEKEELLLYMRDKARVRFMSNPWSKTWTVASAAVVLAFGVLYFTIGNTEQVNTPVADNKTEQKEEKITNQSDSNQEEDVEQEQTPDIEIQKQEEVLADKQTPQPESIDIIEEDADAVEKQIDFPEVDIGDEREFAANPNENNLPVKEDILLFDTSLVATTILPKELKANLADITSIDSSTTGQRKKAKVKNDEPVTVRVEFWKSPINYSGYRFDGKKLQLFGTYNIVELQLYHVVKDINLNVSDIYLRIGEKIYLLDESNSYSKLKPVQDENLLEQFK